MGNSIEPNTKEYYQLQSEYWFNECCKCTNACNELINDIEEVKRKARAFEEIKANLSHVLDLKKHETLDYKDCKVLREIFKETEDELECD
ncbi:hypothetical protein [Staphylococcus petrasii]|uniref:hypothetical protein n=1 Tax=Staphylococcus petrasii TaxID=1276936 RepID=UPI003F664E06